MGRGGGAGGVGVGLVAALGGRSLVTRVAATIGRRSGAVAMGRTSLVA